MFFNNIVGGCGIIWWSVVCNVCYNVCEVGFGLGGEPGVVPVCKFCCVQFLGMVTVLLNVWYHVGWWCVFVCFLLWFVGGLCVHICSCIVYVCFVVLDVVGEGFYCIVEVIVCFCY